MTHSMFAADADAPVSETTEKFMRAIVVSVPIDSIEELHLFTPLRQGTMETGLAVIAARVETVSDAPDVVAALIDTPAVVESSEAAETGASEVDTLDDATLDDANHDRDENAQAELALPEELPELIPMLDADESGSPTLDAPVVIERHRVYTARYRYTIKGPERGKWDVDVRDEADAPLLAVETVVRGVQRRAGDVADPIRFNNAQIRHALRFEKPSR